MKFSCVSMFWNDIFLVSHFNLEIMIVWLFSIKNVCLIYKYFVWLWAYWQIRIWEQDTMFHLFMTIEIYYSYCLIIMCVMCVCLNVSLLNCDWYHSGFQVLISIPISIYLIYLPFFPLISLFLLVLGCFNA